MRRDCRVGATGSRWRAAVFELTRAALATSRAVTRGPRTAAVVMLATALLFAAGCGTHSAVATTQSSAPATAARPASEVGHWLITATAIQRLRGAGMSAADEAAAFDNPGTYLTGDTGEAVTGLAHAVRAQTFTSVAALRQALDAGRVGPQVRTIVYDNEDWSLTPPAEQRDPAAAEAQAADLAHAHHLLLIATPATTLTRALAPGQRGYPAYLSLGIAAAAAKVADVIDIQSQGAEADTATFTDFVRQATAQARQANPHVTVLAGLSTNPSGSQVTADQLKAAITATHTLVDGYWLNIPAAGTACPRCGQARPQVAIDLLRSLGS
ncbi:hypothetical protein ABIA39_003042 [Nocardia sp. GAS34]